MKIRSGQVAVVTGAASGIGRATAVELARRGCGVALVDIDEAGLRETADQVAQLGRHGSVHVTNVADRQAMAALPDAVMSEHGRVDIVVNNAGVSVGASFEDHSIDDFEWIVGINLWGVVYGCKYFLPLLRQAPQGHIVNLSSMFGFLGVPSQSSYSATKAAVRAFSEALWAELRGSGIGVTCVHPGGIATNIVRASRVYDSKMQDRSATWMSKFGAPPAHAAQAIIRGIEQDALKIRIRPESYVTEWLKRLFPVGIHRVVSDVYQRRILEMERDASSDAETSG